MHAALATVDDPEIHQPITELGMVKGVTVGADGDRARRRSTSPSPGCPMRETITTRRHRRRRRGARASRGVRVELDVMSDEQRTALRRNLRGDAAEPVIPFAQPGSLTRVYAWPRARAASASRR